MPDPAQVMKNGASPPAFPFPAGGAATVSAAASPMEASVVAGFPYKSSETPKSYSRECFFLPLGLNRFVQGITCTVNVPVLFCSFFFSLFFFLGCGGSFIGGLYS